ncbi:MAG: dihydrofolate reductase [Bacteroidota bacterium]|nr:dihydrofolate reductase [Bacteroidota bacterium]
MNYVVDQFADMQILRYDVPGFDKLTLKQKELIYYLNEAALQGRDILFDQNDKHNLCIRRTLESIYKNAKVNRNSEDWKQFVIYFKRVLVSNGIHHHYATDKFVPGFSKQFFSSAVLSVNPATLPLAKGETAHKLIDRLTPILFDPAIDAKRVNQKAGQDLLMTSAENYYQGVTQEEAETFYNAMKNPNDQTPVSYGLNSRLVKENGKLVEKVWKEDGLYGPAIKKIIYWLEKAATVAENDKQAKVIRTLIDFYKTGSLKTFDDYSIDWVKDLDSRVDFVNGFIESYGDPLGLKGSWESTVNFKNEEATKRTETISSNAQWFEDHSPVEKQFKKETVKGVTAKVITVTMLGGDCYPTTPIGINLPNSNWIRRDYGSKSVTIDNISEAYDKASQGSGFNEEFMWSDKEIALSKNYGFLADNLHTDLHECLGHGSGKLLPGVDPDALKAYGSTIEEARADLFGLYYLADPKLIELGLVPNDDVYKAEYYKNIMNGLMTQLIRIEPGNNIEESHMRDRALIASWVYEKGLPGNVIELKQRDGKTYVVINDYPALRTLYGQLLAEIQRIKSTGDFEAARNLVEQYGVKVDSTLHKEIRERYAKLNLAPYKGFVNPVYKPVYDKKGKLTDIKVSYTEGFIEQNLRYSKDYSNLPTDNN